jgi:hypothetical protein
MSDQLKCNDRADPRACSAQAAHRSH